MNFASYSEGPAALAADLVNTYGWVSGVETLDSDDDLVAFLAERPELSGLPPVGEGDLARVKELRELLRAAFISRDSREAAAIVNQILAECHATPRLSTNADPPHLHFEPETDRLVDWLAATTAMGMTAVIAENGTERLGTCSADDCRDVFIDTSRNRSRRHCSDGCRTRANVAAYRRRQKDKT